MVTCCTVLAAGRAAAKIPLRVSTSNGTAGCPTWRHTDVTVREPPATGRAPVEVARLTEPKMEVGSRWSAHTPRSSGVKMVGKDRLKGILRCCESGTYPSAKTDSVTG